MVHAIMWRGLRSKSCLRLRVRFAPFAAKSLGPMLKSRLAANSRSANTPSIGSVLTRELTHLMPEK
jgi:hypothetical protein